MVTGGAGPLGTGLEVTLGVLLRPTKKFIWVINLLRNLLLRNLFTKKSIRVINFHASQKDRLIP